MLFNNVCLIKNRSKISSLLLLLVKSCFMKISLFTNLEEMFIRKKEMSVSEMCMCVVSVSCIIRYIGKHE